MSRQAYPLSWPNGWKRTPLGLRSRARFKRNRQELSIADAVGRILTELSSMGISSQRAVISTNVEPRLDGLPRSGKEVSDPGAAVYWEVGKSSRCMAIDMYDRVADNLAAIAATLSAMRAIERHGGATILDRAFTGFAALPERASQNWREVLGVTLAQPTLAHVEERFRTLAQVHHPDKGGDSDKFNEIVQAREAARMELSN